MNHNHMTKNYSFFITPGKYMMPVQNLMFLNCFLLLGNTKFHKGKFASNKGIASHAGNVVLTYKLHIYLSFAGCNVHEFTVYY